MAEDNPETGNKRIHKFLRKVRNSKPGAAPLLDEWPRRAGKTTVLRGKIRPLFKKERKMKTQFLNGIKIKYGKIIRRDTQVIIVDEFTNELIKKIRRKRPDIIVVGLGTLHMTDNEITEDESKNLAFE